VYATKGTSTYLREHGVETTTVFKIDDNMKPNAIGLMREGKINLIINTPSQMSGPVRDGHKMRRLAVELEIPFLTTIQGADAAVGAIRVSKEQSFQVRSMSEFHTLKS
jgi:carbamoyl-phosphate synthase large subunit